MDSGAREEVRTEYGLDGGLDNCWEVLSSPTTEWCSRQYTELPGSQHRREIFLAVTNWMSNLGLTGVEGPPGDLHGSWEYYFSFCPVNGWVMMDQPIVTKDDRVSFIQFCDIELCLVGFASGES